MPLFPPSSGGTSTAAASGPVEVQYANYSQGEGGVLSNGVEYVPLVKSASDYIEFQLRATVTGTLNLRVLYVMSAANSGNIRLRLDRLTVAAGSNPTAALTSGTAFTVTPGNDANVHALSESDSTDLALSVTSGQLVRLRLNRIADGNDTHTGDVRIITVTAVPA